jgi:ribA/ribD-fused uncharacterized protein
MMMQKALFFDDFDVADAIRKESHPKVQKELGRTVKNFDETRWNCVARNLVKPGLEAKFRSSESLMRELESTKGKVLVEASPSDRIWGIGLGVTSNKIYDMRSWNGLNWLGFMLTDLRVSIFGE